MPSDRPPNLILFCCDHYRGDVLGHAGNPAAVTPRLDGLVAEDAASFTRAYCQNGVCTPSRCSFLTGWYPHVRGRRTMHHMLAPDEPMLLKTLKEAGYFVWWAGKNDVIPGDRDPSAYCDVRYCGEGARRSYGARDSMADWRGSPREQSYYAFFAGRLDSRGEDHYHDEDWDSVEAAIQLLDSPPDRPWCLYFALSMPDTPYGVEEPWYSMIDRDALPARIVPEAGLPGKARMLRHLAERYGLRGWPEAEWRELRAAYYGKCARADHLFGMLVDALRERDLYDQTAMVFFSDHGDYTGDFDVVDINQNTFEGPLVRVPLVIKPPASTPIQPGVRDAMVELVDLPATVFELAGIEPGYTHFGKSLLPAIASRRARHHDAVFAEGGRRLGERHCMELESVEAHEPDSPYWPRVAVHTLDDRGTIAHGKAVMCRTERFKYVRRLYEDDEFYDLDDDPMELRNASHDPRYAAEIARHRELLLQYFLEAGDVVSWRADQRH